MEDDHDLVRGRHAAACCYLGFGRCPHQGDVTEQVIALGFYGILMALVFFYFQAPGVALSQITVGAVALPLMRLLRALQSGHPGDYVLYLTMGLAVFGSAAMVLLRS